jgi:hypothetical protein
LLGQTPTTGAIARVDISAASALPPGRARLPAPRPCVPRQSGPPAAVSTDGPGRQASTRTSDGVALWYPGALLSFLPAGVSSESARRLTGRTTRPCHSVRLGCHSSRSAGAGHAGRSPNIADPRWIRPARRLRRRPRRPSVNPHGERGTHLGGSSRGMTRNIEPMFGRQDRAPTGSRRHRRSRRIMWSHLDPAVSVVAWRNTACACGGTRTTPKGAMLHTR